MIHFKEQEIVKLLIAFKLVEIAQFSISNHNNIIYILRVNLNIKEQMPFKIINRIYK